MHIEDVMRGVDLVRRTGPSVDVNSIEYDSRRVTSGSLFVAMQGGTTDGNRYISSAIERGALAVVTDSAMGFQDTVTRHPHMAVVEVAHGRSALAAIAANYYGHPEKKLVLSGVTGTNGKTTTAFLLDAMLNSIDRKDGCWSAGGRPRCGRGRRLTAYHA